MTKAHMAHDGFDSSVCKVASATLSASTSTSSWIGRS